MNGYSDAVNHALAFAAKHHDQEVRKGTRAPYLTAAPSVAVILARYDQDDATIVTAIVHDAVEDFVRDGYTREMLTNRVADKFGAGVLEGALSIVERRADDEGVELFPEERKDDLIARLPQASAPAGRSPRSTCTRRARSSRTCAARSSPNPSGAATPRVVRGPCTGSRRWRAVCATPDSTRPSSENWSARWPSSGARPARSSAGRYA